MPAIEFPSVWGMPNMSVPPVPNISVPDLAIQVGIL